MKVEIGADLVLLNLSERLLERLLNLILYFGLNTALLMLLLKFTSHWLEIVVLSSHHCTCLCFRNHLLTVLNSGSHLLRRVSVHLLLFLDLIR